MVVAGAASPGLFLAVCLRCIQAYLFIYIYIECLRYIQAFEVLCCLLFGVSRTFLPLLGRGVCAVLRFSCCAFLCSWGSSTASHFSAEFSEMVCLVLLGASEPMYRSRASTDVICCAYGEFSSCLFYDTARFVFQG